MNIALVDRQRIRAVFMFRADNALRTTTTIVSLYDRAVPLDNAVVSPAADSQKISMNHPLTVNRPISTAITNRLQSLGIAASDCIRIIASITTIYPLPSRIAIKIVLLCIISRVSYFVMLTTYTYS